MYGHSALNRSNDTARPGRVPLPPRPVRPVVLGSLTLPKVSSPPGPREADGRFAPGWGGKPRGALNRSTYGQLWHEGMPCEALDTLVAQALRLRSRLDAGHFPTTRAWLKTERQYCDTLRVLNRYFYAKPRPR